MAVNSPTGIATTMAMVEISRVPMKTGTAPKAPAPATWSSRMAICGSQRRPNRNSCNGTRRKNSKDS